MNLIDVDLNTGVGLISLPCEILLEITSYFGSDSAEGYSYMFPSTSIQRQYDIRNLMRTCNTLRSCLAPYYWQRLDACFDRGRYFREEKETQERWENSVLGHLQAVTSGDRNIAQYVRAINISLFQSNLEKTLVELKHCMALCPNLDTIQIMGDCLYTMMSSHTIARAFHALKFPNIHTACLIYKSRSIIKSLPNLRNLYWFSEGRINLLESATLQQLSLESFHGLSPTMIQSYRSTNGENAIEEIFGQVKTLELDLEGAIWDDRIAGRVTPQSVLRPLTGLPQLHTLLIRFPDSKKLHVTARLSEEQMDEYITYAKGWLRNKIGPDGTRTLVAFKDKAVTQRIRLQQFCQT